MGKKIAIIGAGIAGLSAGCYAQMNGYETEIFELHDVPGGLCTAWKRGGYTFDGCIEWLVGTNPESGFHRIWEELGAIQGRGVVNHEEFCCVEGEDGRAMIVYGNAGRLRKHLQELAPEDAKTIAEMTRDIEKLAVDIPTGLVDMIKILPRMLPFLSLYRKYGKMPMEVYVRRFRNPFLKQSMLTLVDMADFPAFAFLIMLGFQHARAAGYTLGGSLEFARAIEGRYLGLGGKVHYRSRVTEILVEDDATVGVRLADGTEYRADRVISAADGHATIFEMLHEKYIDEEIRANYREMPVFSPIIQVSLGVARDFRREPHMLSFPVSGVTIDGKAKERLSVKHYCYDPSMAPPGKSSLVVIIPSDYDYWKRLETDDKAYLAEKAKVLEQVLTGLEQRFPGLREEIEVSDVATPLTYERYTGNWRGSMEGWMVTTSNMTRKIKKTLPGLKNFHMVGQWVQPGGGLPPAAQTARDAVKDICREDGRKFKVTIP